MDKREIITKFIWSEIENLWQNCLKDRPENKIMGVPPDSFFIEERSSANRRGECDGNTLNVYIRDDMGTRQLSYPFPEYDTGARRKAYWEIGHVSFHIAPGGENAVFCFQIGPRYGRGWNLKVDTAGRIVQDTNWMS